MMGKALYIIYVGFEHQARYFAGKHGLGYRAHRVKDRPYVCDVQHDSSYKTRGMNPDTTIIYYDDSYLRSLGHRERDNLFGDLSGSRFKEWPEFV